LPHHEGNFDKVHVGGLCALEKVPAILKLLKPEGGRIVVPSGPDLLSITVVNGKVSLGFVLRVYALHLPFS
jgi:protein-L-isoaspartate O-methyltransferase